jgi:hypothetical protein
MTANGTSIQYLKDITDNYGFHHSATMVPLEPSTQYTYQCGDGVSAWSEAWNFTTASHDIESPFSMSIFGDMGYLGSEERPMIISVAGLKKHWSAVPTRQRMEILKNAGEINAVWHLGDIGYLDDSFAHTPIKFSYEKDYNAYVKWLTNISATMPYMTAVGNHESECHSPACIVDILGKGEALRNFSAYNARWPMPSKQSGGVGAMWYSFNMGPIHFVTVNTETDFRGAGEENHGDSGVLPAGHFAPDGEYLKWLEADLAAARGPASATKWIIAGGHRPFGDIAESHGPLFAKYNVELYFAGHSHSYARSLPSNSLVVPSEEERATLAVSARAFADVELGAFATHGASYVNTSDPAMVGTNYVVVGGAGCDEMDEKDRADAVPAALAPRGAGPVYATDVIASGVLKVFNSSALRWQLLRSVDGTVLDELWLTK